MGLVRYAPTGRMAGEYLAIYRVPGYGHATFAFTQQELEEEDEEALAELFYRRIIFAIELRPGRGPYSSRAASG